MPYTFKEVEREALTRVLALQEEVYETLPDRTVFVRDTEEEMRKGLSEGGIVLGVWTSEGELAGYRYVSYPGRHVRNLGYDLGFEGAKLEDALQLESTVIAPAHRGQGLQKATFEMLVKSHLIRRPSCFVCTIAPKNIGSLKNMMRAGLVIKALKHKYASETAPEGVLRFILYGDVPLKAVPKADDRVVWVPLEATEQHMKQLHKGLAGVYWSDKGPKIGYRSL